MSQDREHAGTRESRYRELLERAAASRVARQKQGHPRGIDLLAVPKTRGEEAADAFAALIGSWPFITVQSTILAAWVVLNVVAWIRHWDPYPFILLNLMLSFQAAYAGPIILMSQNRAGAMDRLEAQRDYRVNMKAELEVEEIIALLHAQTQLLEHLSEELDALKQRVP